MEIRSVWEMDFEAIRITVNRRNFVDGLIGEKTMDFRLVRHKQATVSRARVTMQTAG